MPWKVEEVNGGYYVTNLETGERMSRRPLSKKRADAQARALYANVPEATVTVKRIRRRADMSKADRKRGVAKYGEVEFADPVNKKYPIDTPGHIRAAWNYIHHPRNAAKYGKSGGLSAVQTAIIAAWTKEFGHPPQAKKIRVKELRAELEALKGAGNMAGLAKHLAEKYWGDPDFFTKCMGDEGLAGYEEDVRAAICAKAHKIAIGIWPAEHTKDHTPTIRNILEGKIHQGFTVAADQLFQRGYIDRDTRIALSGLIGDVLSEFGERFGKTGLDREIDPADASEIATKEVSTAPTGIPGHGPGGLFATPGLGGAVANTPMPNKKRKKKPDGLRNKELTEKGSAASGFWGHGGRLGVSGGSASRFGSSAAMSMRSGPRAAHHQGLARMAARSLKFESLTAAEMGEFSIQLQEAVRGLAERTAQGTKALAMIAGSVLRARPECDAECNQHLDTIHGVANGYLGLMLRSGEPKVDIDGWQKKALEHAQPVVSALPSEKEVREQLARMRDTNQREQKREYSRIKDDDKAASRLRDLRLEGRTITKALHRISRNPVSLKEFNDDWMDSYKEVEDV